MMSAPVLSIEYGFPVFLSVLLLFDTAFFRGFCAVAVGDGCYGWYSRDCL
jgi:hypothetical protein